MDYAKARHAMVEGQLRTNRVVDPALIAALEEIPREQFVPARLAGIAYVDEGLPLGHGRYLMEPLALARMIEAAQIEPANAILDVGCATGYSSALISRLAQTVVALEEVPEFAREANRLLGALGCDNAAVVDGKLVEGCRKQAPYDVILVQGAVEEIPDALTDQLAEGGRLVAIIAAPGGIGRGTVITKLAGTLTQRSVFDAGTPVLPGFQRKASFAF
jgi:protein-L-isoaspartate(D-aspartate) O-methyltransferase